MLLLPIVIVFSSLSFSAPPETKIKSFFKSYINNVSKNTFDKKYYTKDFEPIIKDDKKIFNPCSKNHCSATTQITKMKHKNNLWKLQTQVSYKGKKINSRQGCYFIINEKSTFKMANYIDECNER